MPFPDELSRGEIAGFSASPFLSMSHAQVNGCNQIPMLFLCLQAQDPQMLDQLSKNITRCGLSNSTLNYLRVSVMIAVLPSLSRLSCMPLP